LPLEIADNDWSEHVEQEREKIIEDVALQFITLS